MNGLKSYLDRLEKMPEEDDENGISPYERMEWVKALKYRHFYDTYDILKSVRKLLDENKNKKFIRQSKQNTFL